MFEVCNSLGSEIKRKRLEIKMHQIGNCNTFVYTDSTRVKLVLINVLSNAIKFSDHGKTIMLNAKISRTKDYRETLKIIVKDTGCGIE